VLPSTAREVRAAGSAPARNVLAGARYLRRMLARFQQLDLALAAYNAGPAAVQKAGGAPGGQTLTYIANVLQRARALGSCR
jgi:soluble lytic murein transglycosylase-like protein